MAIFQMKVAIQVHFQARLIKDYYQINKNKIIKNQKLSKHQNQKKAKNFHNLKEVKQCLI